jgi:exodeoxyribonuclease VII large subunit
MQKAVKASLHLKRSQSEALSCRISALNPKAVLDRGYSIVRRIPDWKIITDTGQVETGENIEVMVSRGTMTCRVEKKD